MAKIKPFSILYAEDDSLIRSGYINYFKTVFESVYEACDGREALELYEIHRPDILLFDLTMPYIDGLSLVKRIRESDTHVKIIILTAHMDSEKLLKAIPLGLIGYLQKPVKRRELSDILLQVTSALELERKNSFILQLSQDVFWDSNKNIIVDKGTSIHLTRNEIILLNILSSKAKIHYSLDEILEEFWVRTNQKEMSQNSIRNIIKRLKSKLPENSIENHYGIGYKLCTI